MTILILQKKSTIGLAVRHKNLFVFKTGFKDKTMLVQKRVWRTYLLSSNLKIRLWHYRLGHASNVRVVQASKLVDEIDLKELSGLANKLYSSNSESNNDSDADILNVPAPINKITQGMEKFYEAYIESKYIRIIKSKKMTPITRRLQEIHADLWSPHKSSFILGKNHVALLLDEFTQKSWILMLRSKDEFFDVFKHWLPRAEACESLLNCLQTDGRGEFISIAL